MEETRVNLRQALTAKESLAEGVIDSVSSRDLEKKICAKKKLVVDDYLDAVEKAAAVYRVTKNEMRISSVCDFCLWLCQSWLTWTQRSHATRHQGIYVRHLNDFPVKKRKIGENIGRINLGLW